MLAVWAALLWACSATADVSPMYLIDNARTVSKAGGRYTPLLDSRCRNVSVWRLSEKDGIQVTGPDTLYLFLHSDDHWSVSPQLSCSTDTVVLRSLASREENIMMKPENTGPDNIEWTRSVSGVWRPEEAIRIRKRGCNGPKGCLQLNCQEPEDGKMCSECTLSGASLDCSSPSNTRVYFLITVVTVVCIVLLLFLIWVVFTYRGVIFKRRDASDLMARLGATIARNARVFAFVTIAGVVLFAATGMPMAEVQKHGKFSTDWAARGGSLERQLEFVDKWTESSKQRSRTVIMVGRDGGGNAATIETAKQLLTIVQEVYRVKIQATYNNGTRGWLGMQDFCASTDMPGWGGMPCYVPSILDCFLEGAWVMDDVSGGRLPPAGNRSHRHENFRTQYDLVKSMNVEDALGTYDDKPSLFNVTEEEFNVLISGYPDKCHHWVKTLSHSREYLLGSATADSKDMIVDAKKLNAVLYAYAPDRAKLYKDSLNDMAEREVDDSLQRWYDAVSDLLEGIDNDEGSYNGVEVSVFMSSSPQRMFEEISKARGEQLVIGVVIILVIAVLTQFSMNKEKSLARAAIVGVFLVVLSNVGAYGFIALLGIKYNHAMLQALPFLALGLGVDDMFLLLHYFREVPDKDRPTEEVLSELYREGGVSVTLTSVCNAAAFFSGMMLPIPALREFLASAGIIVVFNYFTMIFAFPGWLAWECDRAKRNNNTNLEKPKSFCSFSGHVHRQWIPFLQHKGVQIFGTLLGIGLVIWCIVSLMVVYPLDFGSSMTDLTPKGSYLSKGFADVEEHLLSQRQEHSFVIKGSAVDVNTRHGQFLLQRFYELISTNKWTSDAGFSANTKLWLHFYFSYLAGSEVGEVWDVTGLNQTGKAEAYNYNKLVYTKEPVLPRYHQWRDPVASQIYSTTSQLTDGFAHRWGTESYDPDNTIEMTFFAYSLDITKLQTTDEWLTHIDDFEKFAEEFFGTDQVFPHPSSKYLQVKEFSTLRQYFTQAFIVSAAIIFCCCLLLSVSLRGALLITAVSVCGTLEVAAFIMMCGLDFSSLVAVTLLMSTGMFVEFSAHVVVGYESFEGNRRDRLANCISKTFVPVMEGGVSSLLSFCMLAMSQFPYVFKYFFLVFLVVILFGLIHGIFVLPAILGLIGRDSLYNDDVGRKRESDSSQGSDCHPARGDPMIDVCPPQPASILRGGRNPLASRHHPADADHFRGSPPAPMAPNTREYRRSVEVLSATQSDCSADAP